MNALEMLDEFARILEFERNNLTEKYENGEEIPALEVNNTGLSYRIGMADPDTNEIVFFCLSREVVGEFTEDGKVTFFDESLGVA